MAKDKKETILFVDDEESILRIADKFFSKKGYGVLTATNGCEALQILEKKKIDCCFADINMPEMDGLEFAEHIRTIDNTIPVIVMTGYPSLDNTISTLKNGVVDFLIKPVDLKKMEWSLERVLRERRLFEENLLLKKELEKKTALEKLNRELCCKVEELYVLNKIMSDVSRIRTGFDMYGRILDMVMELTHADESSFYVINETEKRALKVLSSTSTVSVICGNSDAMNPVEELIMETVSDEIPLLIPENKGARGLPLEILSFMVIPLKIQEKVFGVLTASIKKGDSRFTEKDLYYLSFMTQRASYLIENFALYEHINQDLISTLEAFVKTIEARDPYTQKHSSRVTAIAVILAKALDCSEEEIEVLNIAGLLHDIGKIGIRDDILLKPGFLNNEEFDKIKEHPVIGSEIVKKLGLWDREQKIVRHHHENFDGTGYPDGLKKDEIPFLARILSIADVYDAIGSIRTYRGKMESEKILETIKKGAGTQFDPSIVEVFLKLCGEGKIS
ncbi:MAG: response regulator [Deltaproteobacteria bacterium]|nr:response regulator [Deltaproteobacteria bacterium]